MNLYIYKYNNYYNRIVKKEDTFAEYGEPIYRLLNCKDFSPNDGVNTIHIFGSAGNNYNGSGDYLIVTNEYDEIISRWFIIETTFTRAGQWNITLRRDLVVDYYETIVNAPCFIEKASLTLEDPLIYNDENMVVNQIKTGETLLKDQTKCPWLVGYYASNTQSLTGSVSENATQDESVKVLTTPITGWEYFKYCSLDGSTPSDSFKGEIQSAQYIIKADTPWVDQNQIIKTNYINGDTHSEGAGIGVETGSSLWCNVRAISVVVAELKDAYLAVGLQSIKSRVFGPSGNPIKVETQTTINEFKSLIGTTIKDSQGAYYEVQLRESKVQAQTADITGGAAFLLLKDVVSRVDKDLLEGTPNDKSFQVYANVYTYTLQLVNVTQELGGTTYNIPSTKNRTLDAPWNIFAIPYGKVNILNSNGSLLVQTNAELGLQTAMSMLAQNPEIIYDLQLLPYCPFDNYAIQSNGDIIVKNENQYGTITKDGIIKGVILNIEKSRFTRNLNYSVSQAQTAIQRKINNQCDKWRLSSPNYSNYFDFSVEKNKGITSFNIDCEYKPYSPYIHINPNFSGLYGYDDNSPRGLVCGGDYSLSSIVDAWEQYQLQNKNFQNIFDRQIQNMEVNNSIAREQEQWGLFAGAVSGSASGAFAGSMIAPGWGTAIGAVVGGAASLGGGALDVQMNEKLRNEAMDYTKDLFGYQLGNIQALPNTISKVSSLNNNNKIFPVLEYYTCTDREKEALANKIAYNGMTVMVIGNIQDYISNSWTYNNITNKGYIKGRLIRIEGLDDEYHLLKEISNEIYKGVYF